ncbi:phosphatase 2C-like domain-containing protein [Cryomyces antarcticus]
MPIRNQNSWVLGFGASLLANTSPSPTPKSTFATSTPSAAPTSEYHLTYRIAASYSAKGDRLNPNRNVYHFGNFISSQRPETWEGFGRKSREDRPASGEDSFFITQLGNTDSVAFGVADGVGGYNDLGVDPADFAHGLCEYMRSFASVYAEDGAGSPAKARSILQVGYDNVIEDESIPAGGSTAVVAVAGSDGRLEVANLGDSGFLHVRHSAIRYYSTHQTKGFNTPYQLSKRSPAMLRQHAIFGGGTPIDDHPKDADVTTHELRHGDVLVFATDGVWDNLSSQDTLDIISRHMKNFGAWTDKGNGVETSGRLRYLTEKGGIGKNDENTLQAALAIAMVDAAKRVSEDERRDSPFAKEVRKHYPNEPNFTGGKKDDICVVVAIAVEGADGSTKLRAKL